jgi:hypothetical protein
MRCHGLVTRRGYQDWRQHVLENVKDAVFVTLFGNTDASIDPYAVGIGARVTDDITIANDATELAAQLFHVLDMERRHYRTRWGVQCVPFALHIAVDGDVAFYVEAVADFIANAPLVSLNNKAGSAALPSIRYSPRVQQLLSTGVWEGPDNTPTAEEYKRARQNGNIMGHAGPNARSSFPDLYLLFVTGLPIEPTRFSVIEDSQDISPNAATETRFTGESITGNLLDVGVNATALAGLDIDGAYDLQVIPNPSRPRSISVGADDLVVNDIKWSITTLDHNGVYRPLTLGVGGQCSIQIMYERRAAEGLL